MSTIEATPDYLPARMLNEFTYCPRLFYYEWVDGVFAENRETVEGSIGHRRVDVDAQELPPPAELVESDRPVRAAASRCPATSTGSSPRWICSSATASKYCRSITNAASLSRPATAHWTPGTPTKRSFAPQALILRDNGYSCDEAIAYYMTTRQRVRIAIDGPLVAATLAMVEQARGLAAGDRVPPPLVDSPKCPRCSLVGICLPDETEFCHAHDSHDNGNGTSSGPDKVRRLVPARDDLRPLYLNTQGLHVGKSGGVLKVKEKDKVLQQVRVNEICQLNLFGNIQLTTQAIQTLCQADKPIAYFSQGGWFYGVTHGLGGKNIQLRREQFRRADDRGFCLELARQLVAGKIRNQRTMLQRNHVEPPRVELAQMKCMQDDALQAETADQLLGIEGNAARVYFQNFAGMIKVAGEDDNGSGSDATTFSFDFTCRNRRPPRDPVNSLLSLAYSVLAKDLTIVCHTVGFDPYLGFFHQPRFGRASLALDLMEPFRPLIGDSVALSAINTRMVSSRDFVRAGDSVALTAAGRKSFFRAYEQRMDALVTHPLFGYRVNYRRVLEIQARLLARVLTGELDSYPVFTTR